MNLLPSMMTLDFCEWLKNRMKRNEGSQGPDILELILNHEYSSRLKEYANEYLYMGGSFRSILHRYIDSQEFEECLRHCHSLYINEWNQRYHIHPKELYILLHECFHCSHGDRAFQRFIMNQYEKDELLKIEGPISAERLTDSIRIFTKSNDQRSLMNLITALGVDMSVELDFLEWLRITKNQPINLNKIPLSVFENLADEYCQDVGKYGDEKRKLIKAFKQTDPDFLARKLFAVLTNTQAKKMKSLGYIYDRYANRNIPYKCFFLTLSAQADTFEDFINDYWLDLDNLSGDYLDIFYSEADYGKSGYEIKRDMKSLSESMSGNLPCIVLWGEKMEDAKSIDINGLSNADIFRLISSIVDWIKEKSIFKDIIEKAKNMADEFNELKRPVTNITTNVEDNSGIVAGVINDSTIDIDVTNAGEIKQFISEAEQAIKLVRESTEVDKHQKEVLVSIITEAKEAVKSNSDSKMKQSKEKFKYFMLGAGKVIKELLTVLSSLANLAKFFNISTS